MQPTILLAAAAMLAATAGSPALAGEQGANTSTNASATRECRKAARAHLLRGFDRGMQTVANDASAEQRAHGWQYFSDPAACRAVVISPQGDYYYSQGKGLRWVAAAQTQA